MGKAWPGSPNAPRRRRALKRPRPARRDVERAVQRAPRARRALVEALAQRREVLGVEQRRDPPVGDLAGERGVLRPDRRQVDRDALLHWRDRQLQWLARAVGERKL